MVINQENSSPDSASCLDLQVSIQNDSFYTKLYDKRDNFNFEIVNYPYVNSSNIPEGPAYGVYSSRLISIARACDFFADFKSRHDSLCIKLLRQGFKHKKLCRQLNKMLSRHSYLFAKYEERPMIPPSIMANDCRHVTVRS